MTQPPPLEIVIIPTPKQEEALRWVAGEGDPSEYLIARNNELLDSYVNQYDIATAPVPPADFAAAYVAATPAQQAAAMAALGVTVPPIVDLVWNWSNQTSVPPNNAQVRTNNGAWAGATQVNIHQQSKDGGTQNVSLNKVKDGDKITLEHNTDNTRFARYTVVGTPAFAVEYYAMTVTPTGTGGTLPNSGTEIRVLIEAA